MTDQPEALRLADDLDAYHTRSLHKEAAAELRRLHTENEAAKRVESHLFHEGARRGNRMVALEKAARMGLEVLDDAGSRICEVAHHAKADRHDLGKPCPVELRRGAAMNALRAALGDGV